MKTYNVYEVKSERLHGSTEYSYKCVEVGTPDDSWYQTFCDSLGTVEAETEADAEETAVDTYWEDMR